MYSVNLKPQLVVITMTLLRQPQEDRAACITRNLLRYDQVIRGGWEGGLKSIPIGQETLPTFPTVGSTHAPYTVVGSRP